MKIGVLSRWNTACGVSLHAELIGREWVRMGHKLAVFAPNNIRPVGEDEEYVYRCFSDEGDGTGASFLDPTPFLTEDEIFVAQRIEWAPLKPLKEIFPEIRRKAKTIYVVHERKPPENPLFYEFEWDAIVCFDERYKRQWSKIFAEEKIHIIPYPVPKIRKGDKLQARKMLNLPLDEKIILSYGWAPELHINPILPQLDELAKAHRFKFLILVDPGKAEILKPREYMIIRRERPPLEKLYTYLHAADLCLIHKQPEEVKPGEVVVSSSVLTCLGSLTPILTSDTKFMSFLDKEVVKYEDPEGLRRVLAAILEGRYDLSETVRSAEDYARRNSQAEIAKKFINLFESI